MSFLCSSLFVSSLISYHSVEVAMVLAFRIRGSLCPVLMVLEEQTEIERLLTCGPQLPYHLILHVKAKIAPALIYKTIAGATDLLVRAPMVQTAAMNFLYMLRWRRRRNAPCRLLLMYVVTATMPITIPSQITLVLPSAALIYFVFV